MQIVRGVHAVFLDFLFYKITSSSAFSVGGHVCAALSHRHAVTMVSRKHCHEVQHLNNYSGNGLE